MSMSMSLGSNRDTFATGFAVASGAVALSALMYRLQCTSARRPCTLCRMQTPRAPTLWVKWYADRRGTRSQRV
jgi:hypothetical protein